MRGLLLRGKGLWGQIVRFSVPPRSQPRLHFQAARWTHLGPSHSQWLMFTIFQPRGVRFMPVSRATKASGADKQRDNHHLPVAYLKLDIVSRAKLVHVVYITTHYLPNFLARTGTGEKNIFPVQLTTSRISSLTRLILLLLYYAMTIHIHTCMVKSLKHNTLPRRSISDTSSRAKSTVEAVFNQRVGRRFVICYMYSCRLIKGRHLRPTNVWCLSVGTVSFIRLKTTC